MPFARDMQTIIQVAASSLMIASSLSQMQLALLAGPSCDLRIWVVRSLPHSRPGRFSAFRRPALLSIPSRLVLCRTWHAAQLVCIGVVFSELRFLKGTS